jgi:hypothetical protein
VDRAPVPGLLQATGSIRGLLKSGLGRFGLKFEAQQNPGDHPLVVVCVVGGVSALELREAQMAVDERQAAGAKTRVMLMGSALLTPDDVLEKVLRTGTATPRPM